MKGGGEGGMRTGRLHLLLFWFFFFLFQLINQINLAVSFALLETEASVFLLIAMLHMS